jgi:hypothetical protein
MKRHYFLSFIMAAGSLLLSRQLIGALRASLPWNIDS